jgi:hypothetical protein
LVRRKKWEFSIIVTDVTNPHLLKVAWYNPELMPCAANLPKIAKEVSYAILAEVDIDNCRNCGG